MTLSVHQRRLYQLISEWKQEGVPTSALQEQVQPWQQHERGAGPSAASAAAAAASASVAVTAIPLDESLNSASTTVIEAEVVVIMDDSHGHGHARGGNSGETNGDVGDVGDVGGTGGVTGGVGSLMGRIEALEDSVFGLDLLGTRGGMKAIDRFRWYKPRSVYRITTV